MACTKLLTIALIATVVISIAFVYGEDDPPTFPPDDVAEILVLGPDGQPVEGAKVELLGEPAVVTESVTPTAVADTRLDIMVR